MKQHTQTKSKSRVSERRLTTTIHNADESKRNCYKQQTKLQDRKHVFMEEEKTFNTTNDRQATGNAAKIE